jgi:hypothetical protein
VRASCQTRRSKGQGRFSTMMSTRRFTTMPPYQQMP